MTSSARVYSGRYFRCRLCYGLRYASQSEKPDQRASDRVRKIAKRLHDKWGGATEDEYDFPPKPPRMRWATVVHKTPPPPDVLSLRDRLAALQLSGGSVPKHIATGILTLIERARPEGGLCHADLHPGNVIMTADGPKLVDWTGAVRAPAVFDLACGHIILVEVARSSSTIRSGRAPTMQPRNLSTRGWPACPPRRSRR